MITNENLVLERPHLGAMQRLYRLGNGYGLSVVNSPMLHGYPFAWEAAVVTGMEESGNFAELTYETPLTSDVEVFETDEEANTFIQRAIEWGAA